MKRKLIFVHIVTSLIFLNGALAASTQDEGQSKKENIVKALDKNIRTLDLKIEKLERAARNIEKTKNSKSSKLFESCSKGLKSLLPLTATTVAEALLIPVTGGFLIAETLVLDGKYLLRQAGVEIDKDKENPYKHTANSINKIKRLAKDNYIGLSAKECAKMEDSKVTLQEGEKVLLGELEGLKEQRDDLERVVQATRKIQSKKVIEAMKKSFTQEENREVATHSK